MAHGSLIHERGATANDLRPRMRVLEILQRELGGPADSVRGLVGLQHLFGSTATLIDTVAAGRVNPADVFLLGKPYSTNPEVMDSLRRDSGYWVHPDSVVQDDERESDALMDERIDTLLRRVRGRLGRRNGRIVLIDDGARAIRMLHEPRFTDIRDRFTCVEQTRCGSRQLEEMDLRVPVVNVAECWAKLQHESPLIAASVNRELKAQLQVLQSAGYRIVHRAGIIGYGSIGRAVARELAGCGHGVHVYEPDPRRAADARRDGFATRSRLSSLLGRGGLIVGCTGLPVLDHADYDRIPAGTFLVSASSADVEFRAWNLRRRGENLGRPESWGARDEHHPCFSLYRIPGRRGDWHLVNGGFPVNFNGGVDPIEPESIQLTRSLLYLGAVQASRTWTAGLADLDYNGQQLIMRELEADAERRAA